MATLINQLLGPSATRLALARAGETGKDRPRLLDFLREQHILTGLAARDEDEAIRALVNRLYATTNMQLPQEDFVSRALAREHDVSTALGRGLMIPHVTLERGQGVKGVLGLSSGGLNLSTPDGRPVHAILLLATPETDRERHLAVLAAFASALTKDLNMREQLYHARTPAHAYDVLHADEAEEINYFLDLAIEDAFDDR